MLYPWISSLLNLNQRSFFILQEIVINTERKRHWSVQLNGKYPFLPTGLRDLQWRIGNKHSKSERWWINRKGTKNCQACTRQKVLVWNPYVQREVWTRDCTTVKSCWHQCFSGELLGERESKSCHAGPEVEHTPQYAPLTRYHRLNLVCLTN